jgi:hypothetical protein
LLKYADTRVIAYSVSGQACGAIVNSPTCLPSRDHFSAPTPISDNTNVPNIDNT